MTTNCVPHLAPDFVIMLTLSGGAVIGTFLAIGCVLANNGIELKFRGLLLSFSLANLTGIVKGYTFFIGNLVA